MKLFKALTLFAVLLMMPATAMADWNFGRFGGFFERLFRQIQIHREFPRGDYGKPNGDDHESPIPEPSGALVMGAGLAVAALARRRNRN